MVRKLSGVLTGPGQIDPDTAKRLEDQWQNDFQGDGVGKIAVLGSGLKFEAMQMSAEASQVAAQLKFGGEQVCMAFHVPQFKVGLGNIPAGLNIQAVRAKLNIWTEPFAISYRGTASLPDRTAL